MEKLSALGINFPSLIVYLVNFLVLLGLLYVLGYKPILRLLDQRSARIRESLDEAERVRQESAGASQEVQARLEASRKEGQAILDQAVALGERLREEARGQARQDAQTIIDQARRDIERQRDEALEELRRHFADLTILAAERVIGRSLDWDAHRQLIQETLEGDAVKGD